ncbi:putative reverse transcriptase domain-containing protein [Tanacetum coccineum]
MKLTQKSVKFEWGDKAKAAFQLLKQKLCSAPILALPEGSENFVVYCDAWHKGLGAVLMQREKVIAYASHQLKVHEKETYTTNDLRACVPVVFNLNMWRTLLYDQCQVGKTVAYRLELPERLSRVHSTFHVSKLKKCMSDEPLAIPLDEIQVDDKLNFIEEPVEIMDREVKHLKQESYSIVKVQWKLQERVCVLSLRTSFFKRGKKVDNREFLFNKLAVLFAWGLRRRIPERADVAGSFLPNLLNTPPSFRGRGRGEGDLSFLSLLKTLACGDGLRECVSPCLLLGSVQAVGVLDLT